MKHPRLVAATLSFASLLVAPAPARAADPWIGVRLGYYTDVGDPFIGGEMLFRIERRIYFNPNLEWVLTDGRFLTLNGDVHYDLPTHSATMVWLGAGLAFLSFDPPGGGGGDSDWGVNLFAGVGRRSGRMIPYLQGKVILKDGSEVVIAAGLRF